MEVGLEVEDREAGKFREPWGHQVVVAYLHALTVIEGARAI